MLAEKSIENPKKRGKKVERGGKEGNVVVNEITQRLDLIHYPHCRKEIQISLKGARGMNFVVAVKNRGREDNWLAQKVCRQEATQAKFKIQKGLKVHQPKLSQNDQSGSRFGDFKVMAHGPGRLKQIEEHEKARKWSWNERGK